MILPNIENFIGCDSSFEEAGIVLYGAPFDSTTSFRPGARFGPSAIRHESFGLETYSPYQDRDLMDIRVFDSGDLELCFGSSEKALADIQDRAEEILKEGKMPLLLGGEHLVTLAAVRAVAGRYPGLHIIHFDAHADLRDDYLGAHLSHACVIRRCYDILGDGRIHQFCIRSGEREEFRFAKEHWNLSMRRLCRRRKRSWMHCSRETYRTVKVKGSVDRSENLTGTLHKEVKGNEQHNLRRMFSVRSGSI